MTRQMVDAILSMSERNRFSKGIFSWVGFDTKYIPVENTERAAGTTDDVCRAVSYFLYTLLYITPNTSPHQNHYSSITKTILHYV